MLECFDKERVCDSQDHVWSRERREEREKRQKQAQGGGIQQAGDRAQTGDSRGLRACGELLELAVMDGEIGAVVTAELEGLQAADQSQHQVGGHGG